MKTNFENAVKMLIEGRCESIRAVGGEITYKIIDGILTQAVFTGTTGIKRPATDFLGEWECIGYTPEMETKTTSHQPKGENMKKGSSLMFADNIQSIGDAIGLEGEFLVHWGTDHIIAAFKDLQDELNPPPEMEEVEVAWWIVMCYDKVFDWFENEEEAQRYVERYPGAAHYVITKVSGTYQRPVKEKVKRRVDLGEVSFSVDKVIAYSSESYFRPYNRPDEIANKTGKIIFEYEE